VVTSLAALENLDAEVDINRTWETSREDIKISAKESRILEVEKAPGAYLIGGLGGPHSRSERRAEVYIIFDPTGDRIPTLLIHPARRQSLYRLHY
jgi:hypothetical protein